METSDFQNEITTLLPHISMRIQEPMAKHTSFRIGGPAQVMAFPKSPSELLELLNVSKLLDCKFRIIGAGTNILAPDQGVEELVICLKDCLDGLKQIDDNHIWAAAGVTMSRAAVYAARCNLGGLEFAHGIPGSVGGGVYMNAGAYGGEIGHVIQSVEIMFPDGSRETWDCAQMEFSYRHSRLEDQAGIILGAEFALVPTPEYEVRAIMSELLDKRKKSQPLDKPSAGSAFKRPACGYAAALIEQAGLKGYRVGDAAISAKHAGFAVNLGNASADEVKTLLCTVSDQVYKNSGIRLEPEIRIW